MSVESNCWMNGALASSSDVAHGTLRSPARGTTRLSPVLWPAALGAERGNRVPGTHGAMPREGFSMVLAFGAESAQG
jgi:hypothetical protein